jgi:hypothetical protein
MTMCWMSASVPHDAWVAAMAWARAGERPRAATAPPAITPARRTSRQLGRRVHDRHPGIARYGRSKGWVTSGGPDPGALQPPSVQSVPERSPSPVEGAALEMRYPG